MKHYCQDVDHVLTQTQSCREGLTSAEAQRRLETNGKNKLAESKKDSILVQFLKQLADPMIIILLAAAAISGVLAVVESEPFTDVIIILAVVLINAILGVYQENKAEKAIEALQEMSAATSKVLRDGKIVSIRSEELVVGDVVLLEAGDAVPADGRIIENASLKIEEAALTGESVPVNKFIDLINLAPDAKDVPLGDRKNMVYMGSTVVYGRGAAVITAIGMDTEMGKIADALAKAEEGQTPLQIKLSQLSRILTWLVLASFFIGHYLEAGNWAITNSADGTTMAFLTMSMAEIFHSFNMRSQRGRIFKPGSQNKVLIGAAVFTLVATTAVCEIPLLANAFGFTHVNLMEYLIAIGLGVLVIPIVEIVKFIQRTSAT